MRKLTARASLHPAPPCTLHHPAPCTLHCGSTGASYDLYPGLLQHIDVLIYNGDARRAAPNLIRTRRLDFVAYSLRSPL